MSADLYPLLLTPVYQDYIWGGTRIARVFARDRRGPCAESWEISDRPEGMSVVRNGPLEGTALHDLFESAGPDLAGAACRTRVFPLLIKIIDASKRLSVQVHPDEAAARRHGGEPKTEMWYVLDAPADGRLFAGLKPGTDRSAFQDALAAGSVEDLLCPVAVRAGEALFVPGGRVHCIGEGYLLLEIQQNSNTTYRVYDWGRVGTDGKPRALHVEQALRAINWNDPCPAAIRPEEGESSGANPVRRIVHCPYFHVDRIDLVGPESVSNDGRSFHALFAATGAMTVTGAGADLNVRTGDSCLVPAALADYGLTPAHGGATVIRVSLVPP